MLPLFFGLTQPSLAATTQSKNTHRYTFSDLQSVARLLGWVQKPKNGQCSVCNGYYWIPKLISDNPNPASYKQQSTHWTSSGETIFNKGGDSIAQRNVHIYQPGRYSRSDIATIKRDRTTGTIATITLEGHVHMREPGTYIVTNHAVMNHQEKNRCLWQVTLLNASWWQR